MEATALRFARAARTLGVTSHDLGITCPSFRSPPRPDADGRAPRRSIRRTDRGDTSVSVQTKHRPWVAVVADMIDGVVIANDLDPVRAGEVRDKMWHEVEDLLLEPDEPHRKPSIGRGRTAIGTRPTTRAKESATATAA